jgi:hypothetical protein
MGIEPQDTGIIKGLDEIKKAVDKRDEFIDKALKIFETLDREIFEFEPSMECRPNRECLFEMFFKIIEDKIAPVESALYLSLFELDPLLDVTKDMLLKDVKSHIFLKIQQSLRSFYDANERRTFKDWVKGAKQ